ncbi:MAG: DUF937 domain-containing protein [Acaryochloris sp. SU_5_25]|nr:DUF937 domain-containing protein [Acaryochloris sp. SU_5_25]
MGLFDQIVSAIDNPALQANTGQLGDILNTVQQLSHNPDLKEGSTPAVMSLLGNHVRSALKSQSLGQAQTLVSQYIGTSANSDAVNALFPPAQQQQIVQEISQRTGLNSNVIEGLLPTLVPLVLNLLHSGTSQQNPQQGSNPVLSNFLDSDNDGDVDVADALRMAGNFMGQR